MTFDTSKSKSIWLDFIATLGDDDPRRRAHPDAFGFGGAGELAEQLAALVLAGKKHATTSLPIEYTATSEPLPQAGDLSIILDGKGDPVAIIERTSVEHIAFANVSEEFAAFEGEGDGSLRYWREAHTWYFNSVCARLGGTFDDSTTVICQRFRLVWPSRKNVEPV